jgi:hypothetical protein
MSEEVMTPEVARVAMASAHLETLTIGSDEWKEACGELARFAFEASAVLENPDLAKMMEDLAAVHAAFAEDKMPNLDGIRTLARDAQAFGAAHNVESLSTGGEELQSFLAENNNS